MVNTICQNLTGKQDFIQDAVFGIPPVCGGAKRRDISKWHLCACSVPSAIFPLGFGRCEDAFSKAFCVSKNKDSWRKIGAAPFTVAALSNPKVGHITEDDPFCGKFRCINLVNKDVCKLFAAKEFDSEMW